MCVFYSLHKRWYFLVWGNIMQPGNSLTLDLRTSVNWRTWPDEVPAHTKSWWTLERSGCVILALQNIIFKMHPAHKIWQEFGCSGHLSRTSFANHSHSSLQNVIFPVCVIIKDLKNKLWIENIWQRVRWNIKCPNIVTVAETSLHIFLPGGGIPS